MTIRDDKIVSYILKNKGMTLNVKTMDVKENTLGYVIGTGIDTRTIPVEKFCKKDVDNFIEKNAHYLMKKFFFGAFVFDGEVILDVTTYRRYKGESKKLGRIYEQEYIYDCEYDEVIKL